MNYRIVMVALVLCVLAACASQIKVTYEFPAAMAGNVRQQYVPIWEKGKVLYGLNCAGCHNIKKGKRELIPDFDVEELKGYELRVSNAQHEETMPDEMVTAEELGYISTFLLYKNKSGIKRKDAPATKPR